MRQLLLCCAAACGLALPAAADLSLGCFARSYTLAHLRAHPDQIVKSIWLSVEHWPLNDADTSPETWASLVVLTARQGHVERDGLGGQQMWAGLRCHPPAADRTLWICSIDGDGGAFEITRDDGTLIEFRTSGLTIGDWEVAFEQGEDALRVFDLAEKPGQPVTYRLYRDDPGACAQALHKAQAAEQGAD